MVCNAPLTGYGIATVTYVQRVKYPYIYTLSIYKVQQSEYESMVLIYIPTLQYKYTFYRIYIKIQKFAHDPSSTIDEFISETKDQ